MRSSQHRVPCRTVDASLGHRPRGPGGGGGGFIFRHSSTGRFGRPDGGAKMVERAISRITAARIHQRRLCMQRLRVTPADSLYCGVAILAVEGGQWWNKAMDGLFHTYTLHRRKRCPSAVGILGIRTGRPTGGTRPWMACSTHIQTATPAGGLGATCGGTATPEDSLSRRSVQSFPCGQTCRRCVMSPESLTTQTA